MLAGTALLEVTSESRMGELLRAEREISKDNLPHGRRGDDKCHAVLSPSILVRVGNGVSIP